MVTAYSLAVSGHSLLVIACVLSILSYALVLSVERLESLRLPLVLGMCRRCFALLLVATQLNF